MLQVLDQGSRWPTARKTVTGRLGLNGQPARKLAVSLWSRAGERAAIHLPLLAAEFAWESITTRCIATRTRLVLLSKGLRTGTLWEISIYADIIYMVCGRDGHWSEWSSWSTCSAAGCGTGLRTRRRRCDSPSPLNGGQECPGCNEQSELCSGVDNCPEVRKLSTWTPWLSVSSSNSGNLFSVALEFSF